MNHKIYALIVILTSVSIALSQDVTEELRGNL